jgi:Leucine rich repeat
LIQIHRLKLWLIVIAFALISSTSADQTVQCRMKTDSELGKICDIQYQPITDRVYTVLSKKDETVSGFSLTFFRELKFLPKNLSKTFPSLKVVEIIGCAIKLVTISDFSDLPNLIDLNLAFNKIGYVESGAFDKLTKLEELRLNRNAIEHLNGEMFKFNTNLRKIDLSDNRIRLLEEKLFESLVNLNKIFLSRNRFDVIPLDLFKNNRKLEMIWLLGNHLKRISLKLFEDKPSLSDINLLSNRCVNRWYRLPEDLEEMTTDLIIKCASIQENLREIVRMTDDSIKVERALRVL